MKSPAGFHVTRGFTDGLTAHAGFNSRVDLILTGNVYSNVQSSTYVRPRNELECNGFTRAPGHLQKFDLDTFVNGNREMDAVVAYIKRDPFFESNQSIAYRIFHTIGQKRVLHGVIITDANYQLVRRFDREDLGLQRSAKSSDVLDFALKYLAHPRPQAAAPAVH